MDIGSLTGSIEIEDQVSSAFDLIIDRAKKFAEDFDGALGGIAIGASAAAAGVLAIVGAVTALGARGSDINDVSNSLDHFAGSAENADKIMANLRTGTKGVVDDFTLMKESSTILGAGVKLTAEDFGTLGSAAKVLADRGLGPTKDMLALVSDAMVTGKTKALSMKLGVIDAGDAEDKFAKSIGTTKDLLSELGKAEAHRIAVLGMLKTAVADAGDSHRSFGDNIQFAITTVKNWVNELSAAVASSPAVNKAMTDIGAALMEAFGGNSDAAIKNIVGAIDTFARAVSAVAPYIVTLKDAVVGTFNFLSDHQVLIGSLVTAFLAWHGVTILVTGVQAALAFGVTGVTTSIVGAYTAASAFVVASGPLIIAVAAITAAVVIGYQAWQLWKEKQANAAQESKTNIQNAQNLIDLNKRYGTSFTTLGEAVAFANGKIQQQRTAQVAATATTEAAASAAKKAAEEEKKHAAAMIDSTAAAKKYADAHKAYTDALKAQKDAMIPLTEAQKLAIKQDLELGLSTSQIAALLGRSEAAVGKYAEAWKKADDAIKKSNASLPAAMREAWDEIIKTGMDKAAKYAAASTAAIQKNLDVAATMSEQALVMVQTRQLGAYEAQRKAILRSAEATKGSLDQNKAGYAAAAVAVDQWAAESIRALGQVDEATKGTRAEVHGFLSDFAASLTQMAQISDGAFGTVMQNVADVVASWDMAAKASDNYAKATSKAGKAVALVQGAVALAQATKGGGAKGIAGGALAGAEMGMAIAGPWGAAVGAGVGAIIGVLRGRHQDLKRAGTEMGVKFSDGLVDQMKKDQKKLGGQVQAILANLSSVIEEAGGLNSGNLDMFTGKLHDVFSLIETHQLSVAEGAKILDKNWKTFAEQGTNSLGLLNGKLVEIIKLNDKMGTQSKEIIAYQAAQAGNASKGITAALTIGHEALKSYDEVNKKQMELRATIAKTNDPKELEKLNAELKTTMETLNKVGPLWDIVKIHSQEAATAIATSIHGVIAANMQAGMSFIDAVRAAAPSVTALEEQLKLTGFSGGAAFDFIKQEVALANDAIAGPALTAIEGYTAGLVGLNNAGILDQDTFSGLAGQIAATEKALEGQGFSGKAVMAAMQSDLQTIWTLQQQYGYSVDASTQALIDQAVEQGIVGERHKSTSDQMLDATNRMVTVLESLATFMGVTLPQQAQVGANGVQHALDGIDAPDLTVHVGYDTSGAPSGDQSSPDTSNASRGGLVTPSGVAQYLGRGGNVLPFVPKGTDTVPAMLTPGERVLSVAQNKALDQAQKATGTDGQPINVYITNEWKVTGVLDDNGLIETTQRKIMPIFIKQINDNVAGARTQVREAIGMGE